jgi:hypothetical protein
MFTIIPTYFFISLFAAVFILYILMPNPKIIVRHPDPKLLGNGKLSDMYIDDNGVCYKYKREEVVCLAGDKIDKKDKNM